MQEELDLLRGRRGGRLLGRLQGGWLQQGGWLHCSFHRDFTDFTWMSLWISQDFTENPSKIIKNLEKFSKTYQLTS